jgi:DNA-binding NtrC family response regulator
MPAPIIVVHDEPAVRDAAITALEGAGHECAGFADPMTALDAIDDNSRLQLLVTRVDFGKGRLNGAALVRMLQARRPSIKAVFVALPENERHTTDLGTFVAMPLDPPTLVEAVRQALANDASPPAVMLP